MKRSALLIILIFLTGRLLAQTQSITGKVATSTGEAIAGVTIYEKDVPNSGAVTDRNGIFKMELRGKGILVVQSMGFLQKEVQVDGKTEINVQLAIDAKGLEDVVVIGYGQKKKITNTGAVSAIGGAEIRETPTASLQNALAGRVTGFTTQQRSGKPGSDGASMLIRGLSTMSGNGAPLVIVDDLEFAGSISEIDADQVESISILKDASTTAIYGIKGANGVIVITTRRGKNGRPQITLRSEAAGQRPTYLPDYLGSYDVARLRNEALKSDGLAPQFTDDDLQKFKDGSDPYGHPNVDWAKTLLRPFSMQTYNNLNISGGTEKAKYFISAGYLWQNGMVKDFTVDEDLNSNYYYKRYNFRSNLDFNATKSLTLNVDLSGNFANRNEPNIGGRNARNNVFFEMSDYTQLPPFAYNPYNPDGSYGANPTVGSYSNSIIGRFALGGYNRSYDNTITTNLRATQKLDFLVRGLSVKGIIGYNAMTRFWRSMTRTSFPAYRYDAATDTYSPFDPNVFRVEKLNLGYVTDANNSAKKLNLQAAINYDRTINGHHVYALALFNQTNDNRGADEPVYFRGYAFRAGYDFHQKYLFELNAGYNGSSRFSSGKRYSWFPAVSAGWNVAEEDFIKNNVRFIDLLKLRVTYGIMGTDAISDGSAYRYLQLYNRTGTYSIGDVSTTVNGIVEGTLGNDITWEKERQPDFGIDIRMFRGKVTFTADYFSRYRYNIMITRGSVPTILGVDLPPVNLGRVQNRGFEVEAGYNNSFRNFRYSAKANMSYAKNKVLYMDEAMPAYPWLNRTGNPLGSIPGYQFIGYYTDDADVAASPKPAGLTPKPGDLKYADLNKDNVIDVNDQRIMKYPNLPNTILGFTGSVGYKSISFSFTLQSALNFANRKVAESINPFANNLRPIHANAWRPDNQENPDFPRLTTVGSISNATTYPSDYWFRRSDYLRIKTIQLAYDLPKKMAERISLQGIRIYTSGYNLATWMLVDKNIYEVDPETPSGTEGGDYPVQKVINFGLQVTF
jgi:TonB-linked SusC/RagA family outer membrane protein